MVNLDYLYVTNWSLWLDVKLGGRFRRSRAATAPTDSSRRLAWRGPPVRRSGQLGFALPVGFAEEQGGDDEEPAQSARTEVGGP